MVIVFIFLVSFICADVFLLRKQDRGLFSRIFSLNNWAVPAVFTAIVLFLAVTSRADQQALLPAVLFLCPFPFYLGKRREFKKAWQAQDEGVAFCETKISLASETLGIILHWVAGMVLLVVAVKTAARFFPPLNADMAQMVLVTLASSVWMLMLIDRFAKRLPGLDFAAILGLKRHDRSWIKVFLLPIVFGLVFATIASGLTLSRSYQPQTPFHDLLANTTSSWLMLAFFVVAVILAPFFEEVIFRGFFFYVINKLKGRMVAIVSVAAIFSLLHYDQYWGDWMAIAVVTLLGFFLTALRAWAGTSIASMMMHYSFNIGMTVIPLILVCVSNPVYFEYQMRFNELNYEQKEMFLLESIQKHPRHADSYNDLAWIYAEEDINLDDALAYVNQALEIKPDNFAYLDTQAEVLYRMKDYRGAVMIGEYQKQKYPSNEYVDRQLKKFKAGLNTEGPPF